METHWSAFVQQVEKVHEVDYKEDYIPDHNVQGASVECCPGDEETAS